MLFESFESKHLNKTLAYVKDGKQDFLNMLKSIASEIDIPLSKIDDSCLKYMSYNNAIKLKVDEEFTSCSNCEGVGTIKRKWGRGFRSITCPECNGAGKILKMTDDIKYFKFWFNKEGKYLCTTAIDGKYHKNEKDLDLWTKTKSNKDQIINSELKTGTKLYYDDESRGIIIGTLFIDNNNEKFLINNTRGVSTPTGRKWQEYGRKAINIFNINNDIYILSDEKQNDIYWNLEVKIRSYRIDKEFLNKEILKDADFAIVLDFKKQSEVDFKKQSDIKLNREIAKSNATALMSDDEIKEMNLNNYIKQLTDIDLSKGLLKLINRIPSIFGGDNCLYYIHNRKNIDDFKDIIDYLYQYMRESDEVKIKDYSNMISNIIKSLYDEESYSKNKINKRITSIKNYYENDYYQNDGRDEIVKKILYKLEEVSLKINNNLLKRNISTVEDMTLLLFKINGISELTEKLSYYLKNYINRTEYSYSDSTLFSTLSDYSRYDKEILEEDIFKLDYIAKMSEK